MVHVSTYVLNIEQGMVHAVEDQFLLFKAWSIMLQREWSISQELELINDQRKHAFICLQLYILRSIVVGVYYGLKRLIL
jgi:flagellar biogenesis protein FliO